MKELYRKHRKSNRIEKRKQTKPSLNKALGKTTSKFCKRMSHKQMRRKLLDENNTCTYKNNDFYMKKIIWELT